jgi:hypothetical protein
MIAPGITNALEKALRSATTATAVHDLLYLEAWERDPMHGAAAALRIHQIRRANPELAEAIRREVNQRPQAKPA